MISKIKNGDLSPATDWGPSPKPWVRNLIKCSQLWPLRHNSGEKKTQTRFRWKSSSERAVSWENVMSYDMTPIMWKLCYFGHSVFWIQSMWRWVEKTWPWTKSRSLANWTNFFPASDGCLGTLPRRPWPGGLRPGSRPSLGRLQVLSGLQTWMQCDITSGLAASAQTWLWLFLSAKRERGWPCTIR